MYAGEDSKSQDCRRQSVREAVVLAGSAFALARSRSVIISDLSSGGAQVDGRDLPPPGDDVLMVVGPFDSMAKVVWRHDDKCGVQFDDPASDETVARMKREAKWDAVAGWYR